MPPLHGSLRSATSRNSSHSGFWNYLGSNSSTTLPEGSSHRICRPPGPSTMSLRKTVPRCRKSATRAGRSATVRSEEHTSELQSHSDLVCRLLLEKKKDKAAQSVN